MPGPMAKARAIVKRRKAVRNIKKITKTMQMIATAKFQKSLKRAVGTKAYTLKVRELVRELAASVGNVEHPLLRKVTPETRTGRVALMVITSNRGLAGAGKYHVETMYDFSPSARELLDELLPLTVKTALFQAFLDATTSEHVSRMVAMKSATDNADKMQKALTMQYNRARQSQITTELSEIMGGVEAMKG